MKIFSVIKVFPFQAVLRERMCAQSAMNQTADFLRLWFSHGHKHLIK